MTEKNYGVSKLLDIYGDVLSERQRLAVELYYNDDLSLSEIAEELGISRQAVRELIGKAGEELRFLEEKLGLAARFRETQECTERLLSLLEKTEVGSEVKRAAEELAQAVLP